VVSRLAARSAGDKTVILLFPPQSIHFTVKIFDHSFKPLRLGSKSHRFRFQNADLSPGIFRRHKRLRIVKVVEELTPLASPWPKAHRRQCQTDYCNFTEDFALTVTYLFELYLGAVLPEFQDIAVLFDIALSAFKSATIILRHFETPLLR